MDTKNYLKLKKSNCKNCYKCIRNCPVKSIRFSDDQAHIITDECILCGMCLVSCPQNAKEIRNDIPVFDKNIPVYASVAPSFVAEYKLKSFEPMRIALKKLGFADAFETAIGAQVVTNEYLKILNEGRQNIVISTCCHSVNSLVQKYFPAIVPYLADVKSPMLAHSQMLKDKYEGCKTIFIGPCISKKEEADIYGITDSVLTFEELDIWLKRENVSINTSEHNENDGKLSHFYPMTGGIIRSMPEKPSTYTYLSIDGVENCIEAFNEIIEGKLSNCFIEMSACKGSCINGPGVSNYNKTFIQNTLAIDRYAGDNKFDLDCDVDLEKEIDFIGTSSKLPGEATIRKILSKIGKTEPEHELNCSSCGYNTCREKAIAVYLGKADLNMCLPYLKEKAESFSENVISNTPNGIFILDEDLNIQQINNAACKFFKVSKPEELINLPVVDILNPIDYIELINSGKKIKNETTKYLDKFGIYVAETIIYDKEYSMLFSIMRDVTSSEELDIERTKLLQKTVEITDKVIAKQMRIVQEIASLLGETTADTKIALTQLRDTLKE